MRELAVPSASDVLKVLESDFSERNSEGKYVSQEDVRFIQLLSENIHLREDGHLEMPLPFKGCRKPSLPNNNRLASIHLQHVKKRLRVNQQFFDHYQAFMEDLNSKSDAKPTPEASPGEIVCLVHTISWCVPSKEAWQAEGRF